ncbi:D-sedoheptulose 7-phosphate isomerase [soil metagenome]
MSDKIVSKLFEDHRALAEKMLTDEMQERVTAAGNHLIKALQNGSTIFVAGNGGSAADAQHFAAELTGRFESKTRRPLPGISLTTDTSALTAMSNDFGFEMVFARQVEALGRPGDVLVGISTSGRSHNIMEAMDKAFALGLTCIGLVGQDGSAVAPYCAEVVAIPGASTARVQEMHIVTIHAWCAMIDAAFG